MSTQPEPRPIGEAADQLRFIIEHAKSKQPEPKKSKVLRLKKERREVGALERLLDLSA